MSSSDGLSAVSGQPSWRLSRRRRPRLVRIVKRTGAPAFDEARAAELKAQADRNPTDADLRVQLGNLYFDAERYDESTSWYEQALQVNPKNVNASTDLGIAYYYSNQPDRALAQFDRSLAIDPKHSKTLLNIGIVRAFGKQDIDGAEKAWQRVLELSPNTPEADVARKGLDGLRAAHGQGGAARRQKPPGQCMARLILWAILLVIIVRSLSRLLHGVIEGAGYRENAPQRSVGLVRDPVCGVFVVPARAERRHGRDDPIFLFGRLSAQVD